MEIKKLYFSFRTFLRIAIHFLIFRYFFLIQLIAIFCFNKVFCVIIAVSVRVALRE